MAIVILPFLLWENRGDRHKPIIRICSIKSLLFSDLIHANSMISISIEISIVIVVAIAIPPISREPDSAIQLRGFDRDVAGGAILMKPSRSFIFKMPEL